MQGRIHLASLALAGAVAVGGCGSDSTAPAPSVPEATFACSAATLTLVPPSNRLTGVLVSTDDGFDRIAFTFGPSGAAGGASPGLIVGPAEPPFVEGASGLPLEVAGERFLGLRFRDTIVADEQGAATYAGPREIRPGTPAVEEVALAEAFEGHLDWIVGMSAPGCVRVTVEPAGGRLLIDVQHP